MAIITEFLVGGTTGHPSYLSPAVRMPYTVESIVDFTSATIADGDIVQCIQVPAETVVLGAWLEVLTAVTGFTAPLFDVGTGVDQDEWVANADPSTVGWKASVGEGTAGAVHAFFSAADTIDLDTTDTTSGTGTAGKVRVVALLLDVSTQRTTATGDQG